MLMKSLPVFKQFLVWVGVCIAIDSDYRVTDEGSLPEIVQYGPSSSFVFLLLPKDLIIIFIYYKDEKAPNKLCVSKLNQVVQS